MRDTPDLQRPFAQSLDQFGHLDIVVANAGVELIDQPVADFTEADFDRLFSVNTKGIVAWRSIQSSRPR